VVGLHFDPNPAANLASVEVLFRCICGIISYATD